MDRSRNFFLLIATLALAGVLTVACDSGTPEPAADPTEAAMPTDGEDEMASDSRESDEPAYDEDNVIPEAFPEDLPLYPGSNAAQGKGSVVDGIPMAAVQLQTSDSPEEVYEFYVEKFTRDGWTIESGKAMKDKNALSASNGKCSASMLAGPSEDGGTHIFIITEC